MRTQEFFIEGSNPTREVLAGVYRTLKSVCASGPVEMAITGIAEMSGATRNPMAVGSALHQLERAGVIRREYAPGSRTYTTQLILPVKPFDELAIDYDYLDTKRECDEAKLRQMISYADQTGCRHRYILGYFGDADAPAFCGACDYCIAHARTVRAPDERETIAIRKALSCVARLDGRYGRGRITQVLVGSRAKEVLDANLDELPTYGLLADEGSEFVWALLDALIAAECLAVSTGDYPMLSLTPRGREVMRGEAVVPLALPEAARAPRTRAGKAKEPSARVGRAVGAAAANMSLLDALRAWRRAKAAERGSPAYLVYSDRTLEELAAQQPRTNIALLGIHGIGPAKARQFGAETLAIINAHSGVLET